MMDAIAWALIHSLWEGAVLALLLAVALLLLRSASAQARYLVSCLALACVLAAPVYTFLRWNGTRTIVTVRKPRQTALPVALPLPAGGTVDPLLPWITLAWISGVSALALRRTFAWALLNSRARRSAAAGIPFEVRAAMEKLRERLRIRWPIPLRTADWLSSPAVIGWLRPVVLLPASAITGLSTDQLTAVLAHELAHIRRQDYLVNLVQTFVETLLFYHPAAWWISRRIRTEREHCCDDIAVAMSGDRLTYANALVELAGEGSALPELAVAAGAGSLKGRVQRILYGSLAAAPLSPAIAAVVAVAVLCLWGGSRMTAQSTTLGGPYIRWLTEDVVYIIAAEERAAFLRLSTDEEAEKFIEQFWQRRNPNRANPAENAFREEHYRRIAYSNDRFTNRGEAGWKTDRGRIYILYGPPDEIESHPKEGYEQWKYNYLEGIGTDVIVTFTNGRLKDSRR